MTIGSVALIAEIVGGFAVVATLIFFVVEIRRNTDAIRSSTHQQQVDATITIHTNVSNDPDMAKLIVKANSDFSELDDSENLQLLHFYTNYFNMWHFQYSNMKKSIFDNEAWIVWDKGWEKLLRSQVGMREVWAAQQDIYSEDFRHHVDNLLTSFGEQHSAAGAIGKLLKNDETDISKRGTTAT